jgi:PAS domain S-box-containing protein
MAATLPYACGVSIQPGDIVFAVNRDTRLVFWNANARAATGRSAAAVAGQPLAAVFPEHEGGPDRRRFDFAAVLAGRDFSGGFQTRRADGSPVTFYVYATAGRARAKTAGVEPVGVVFVARDVTNRIEVEQAARLKEELYRSILRLARDVTVLLDEKGRILEPNRALADLAGIPEEELLGMPLSGLVAPAGRPAVEAEVARLWRDRETSFEILLVSRAGSTVRLDINASVLVLPGRELAVAVGRDRSEPVRVQQRAQESELKYDLVFAAVRDGVILHTLDGRIVDANDGAGRLFGYQRGELLQRRIEELMPPEARPWLLRLRETVMKDGEFHGEGTGQRRDGSQVPIELSCALAELGDQPLVIVIARDISARRRAEAGLRESELTHRTALNAMSDPAHVIDRDYRIVFSNEAFRRWNRTLGLDDDPAGKNLFEVFPFLGPEVRAQYERVFSSGRPLHTEEAARLRGRRQETETDKLPILEAGRTTRVLTVVRDVTEQKRAAEVLERLAGAAMGFIELPPEADVLLYGGERLAELIPGVAFALDEHDDKLGRLSVRRMFGMTAEEIAACPETLGAPPDSIVFERFDPTAYDALMAGTVARLPGGLAAALPGKCTEEAARALADRLGIDRVEVVGLRRKSRLYGNCTFLLRRGQELDARLVNAFAGQWSIVLERREAALALAASEERYASLFERSPIGIYRTAPDGRILMANPALVRMHGYRTVEEFTRADPALMAARAGYDRDEFVRRIEADGEIAGFESNLMMADGVRRFVRENARAVRGRDGRTLYYEGTVEDLTEQHRAEEELARQARFHELLMDIAATYINLPQDRVDATIRASLAELGGFVGADRAYLFDYEYERGVAVNTHEWCAEGIEPQQERLQAFPLAAVPESLEPHRRGEIMAFPDVSAMAPDSRLRKELEREGVRSILTVPLMAGERCLGFVGFDSVRARREYTKTEQGLLKMFAQMLVDVRLRREAEEALRESRERYSSLFYNSPIGIYRTTPDGRMLMANPALVRMLGVGSFEELVRMNVEEAAYRFGYDREEFKRRIAATGEITGLESVLTLADGTRRYIRENARAVRGPDGGVLHYDGTVEDLTDKRAAEERARDERERAESYLQVASVIIVALDASGRVTLINQKGCELLGVAEADALGSDWCERFVPAADREKTRATFAALMRGEVELTEEFENRVVAAGGEVRLIRWHNALLRDRDGSITGTLSSGQDITERRAADEALRASEERYRALAESSPDYIFVVGRDGRIEYVNRTGTRALGREAGELVGQPVTGLFPPAIAERQARNIQRVVLTGEHVRVEGPSMLAGREVWFNTVLLPLLDAAGAVRAVLGVSRDLTERQRARRELEDSEERYRSVVERALDGIGIVRDGRLVYANPQLAGLGGWTVEEVLGRPFVDFLHPDERARVSDRYRRRLAGEDVPASYETAFLNRDGGRVEVEVKIGVTQVAGAPAELVFARDITERKRGEAARAESEERFRVLFEAAPYPMMLIRDGRCALTNAAGALHLGYDDPAEVVGLDVMEMVVPEDRPMLAGHMARLAAGEVNPETTMRHLARDGSIRQLAAVSRPVFIDGKPAVLVIGHRPPESG